jgi:hypothetical protein
MTKCADTLIKHCMFYERSDHPRRYVTTANKVFFKLVLDYRYFLLQGRKGLSTFLVSGSPLKRLLWLVYTRDWVGGRALILAK